MAEEVEKVPARPDPVAAGAAGYEGDDRKACEEDEAETAAGWPVPHDLVADDRDRHDRHDWDPHMGQVDACRLNTAVSWRSSSRLRAVRYGS